MPKIVALEPNPDWKPASTLTTAQAAAAKKAHEDIQKAGVLTVNYVTAMENIRLSGGMYRIKAEEKASAAPALALEDMGLDQLKIMMVNLGVKTEKKMTKADVISLIRAKMDAIEIEE